MTAHILIAGGYGLVGGFIARHLRARHPHVRLSLAGRNPDAGAGLAAELGATAVGLDVEAPRRGLEAAGPVDLIVAALQDPGDALIDAAIRSGAAHIGITRTANGIAPAVFAATYARPLRPVVPLGHWQAGVLTMAALHAAAAFTRVDRVDLTAVYDMADPIGPMTAQDAEGFGAPALVREAGKWIWAASGSRTRQVTLHNGQATAEPIGVLDLPSVAAVTKAADIRFDLAIAESIGTAAGGPASHDLYIDLAGLGTDGRTLETRTILSDPRGQAHLTGLGAALVAERVLGLDGNPVPPGGLATPESLLDQNITMQNLAAAGVKTGA